MSKLTDALKEKLRIFNPFNFVDVGGGGVYIEYQAFVPGRMGMGVPHGWRVLGSRGIVVDPNGHWTEHGGKTFRPSPDKNKALEDAKAWASEKFGITEWVKAPWRETWVSKEAYDVVMKKLKEAQS